MSGFEKEVKAKASTALLRIAYHIYCLKCWDEDEQQWVIAYIGQTTNVRHREKQHFDICSGARRASAAIAAYGRAHVCFRHLFSRGVSSADAITSSREACALETYLMVKHDTIKHGIQKMREQLSEKNKDSDFLFPDISLPGEPRNFQWNCKRSCTDEALIKEMGQKYEVQLEKDEMLMDVEPEEVEEVMAGVEEAFTLAVKEGEGVRGEPTPEELGTELVVCEKKMEIVTFTIDTPFMVAFQLLDKYESMDPWKEIRREDFLADLDLINDDSLKMHDSDVASFIRTFKLSCHTDKHDKYGMQMTADEAAGALKLVKAWLGTKEEGIFAASHDKGVKKHYGYARELLEYVRDHEGKMPIHTPANDGRSVEERTAEKQLGKRLGNWLGGQNGRDEKRQKCNLYLVVLRHFPSFVFRVRGDKTEELTERAEDVNDWLRKGFGMKEKMESFMPDVRQLPRTCSECGQVTKTYEFLRCWFRGEYDDYTSTLLEGLSPEIAAGMRAIHESKIESVKAKGRKASKTRVANLNASGVVNAGKRKARE